MFCASAFMIAESTLYSKPFQNAIFNSEFITQNEIITLRVSTRQEKFFFQIFKVLPKWICLIRDPMGWVRKFNNFYLLAKNLYYVTKNCVFLLCVTPGAYVYLVRGWAVPNSERVGKGGNPSTRPPLSKTHFRTFQATRTIRELSRFLKSSSFWGQILRLQKFSRSWL